jgi:quinohemoprotein ethanol dehydrogenase
MSFSPATGLAYIPGQESMSTYVPDQNFKYVPGWRNTGTQIGKRPPEQPFVGPPDPPNGAYPQPEGADKQPPFQQPAGFLLAWDPVTQKERWRITGIGVGGFTAGGTLATAGTLVFHGGAAYNALSGEKLWQAQGMPSGIVTPVTYMIDGTQYVSWLAGPPGSNRMFTFVLDGKAQSPVSK